MGLYFNSRMIRSQCIDSGANPDSSTILKFLFPRVVIVAKSALNRRAVGQNHPREPVYMSQESLFQLIKEIAEYRMGYSPK